MVLNSIKLHIINIEDVLHIKNKEIAEFLVSKYNITDELDPKNEKIQAVEVLNLTSKQKLKGLFDRLSAVGSCQEDILLHLRNLLIIDFALTKGFKKIFIGDTAQKIAVKSLSSICKGRGANLFSDISIINKTIRGLEILRPMNDFLTKEILLYNYLHKMEQFFILDTEYFDNQQGLKALPAKGSIDKVLEQFVDRVQVSNNHNELII